MSRRWRASEAASSPIACSSRYEPARPELKRCSIVAIRAPTASERSSRASCRAASSSCCFWVSATWSACFASLAVRSATAVRAGSMRRRYARRSSVRSCSWSSSKSDSGDNAAVGEGWGSVGSVSFSTIAKRGYRGHVALAARSSSKSAGVPAATGVRRVEASRTTRSRPIASPIGAPASRQTRSPPR